MSLSIQSERQVTVVLNAKKDKDRGVPQVMRVPPHTSLDQLHRMCSAKLGVDAKKIFVKGVLLDDVNAVRSGDHLVVSTGDRLYAVGGFVPQYNLCVLGGGGVGKSALTTRYVKGTFVRHYDPTIEDVHRHQIEVDNEVSLLDILDTAGQEEFELLVPQWMRGKDGFLFVFGLDSRSSFENLNRFYSTLCRVHPDRMSSPNPLPIVLVGNKADLRDRREVRESEAQNLAKSYNAQYEETSALTGDGVSNAFARLVRMIRAGQTPRKKKRACLVL
eukprot:gnl/Spiro4/1202_TR629_c0_g2_i1.p1 gnl/Spiro4/1202_TR629_c0_g2~~gnl/Spiro4/1202_TR629_c0_g2_i1.p1  ORF type:complete len:307 (+),score=50.89 gnl/Spiro4/1202_TR629_c0_g2_i1:100-921(+)